MKKLYFLFFFATVIIYFLTSAGHTPYDYFTRLSDAFLVGKYYLTANPPWLSELVPSGNKYFVIYPPMPAILALPFRMLLGSFFSQEYLAFILGAGIVVQSMRMSYLVKKSKVQAVWIGLLVGFGNIIWYMASVGSVWYLGQVSAAFFLTSAICECLDKKRPFIVGLLIGAAYLSRVETILTLPLFLYFLKKDFKSFFKLSVGIIPFLILNFLYNYIRFGVIWDIGYYLIPGVLNEPWYQNGILNLSYIPRHLQIMFLSLPNFLNKFPFIEPSPIGLSILITTPAFLYALKNNLKEKVIQFSWISVVLVSLIIFSHGTTGFEQFGYRFAVDFYPILIFLTIKAISIGKLKWHHWLMLLFCILVNFWGVILINKFGYFSY